jgi:hypothetical protein
MRYHLGEPLFVAPELVAPELAGAGGASGFKDLGFAGAAPVVMPGWLLERGVTSRMPGGAAGGESCAVFWAVEDVPA